MGALLALGVFATDELTGWHSMNFAMRGLLDEPAHLATALVILGALIRVRGSLPDQRFGWAMLACSVLTDLDHLPEEFGSDALTNGTPRPYTHALWVVLTLTLVWVMARFLRSGRPRPTTVELLLAGAAWGVSAHFVRDIATAPMSFWWPVTGIAVEVPYWWYVVALAIIIAIGPVRRDSRSADAADAAHYAGLGSRYDFDPMTRVDTPSLRSTGTSSSIASAYPPSAQPQSSQRPDR